MTTTRRGLTCVITVLVTAGLAACGSSGSSGRGSTSPEPSTSSSGPPTSGTSAPSSSASTGSSSAQAGGSEGGKSSKQIFADAKSALFNAQSVHVTGTVTAHGQQEKLDLRFQGENTSGTQTVGGMVVNVVKIGSTAYIKAPASFWTKTAGPQAAALAGKWIKATGNSNALGSLTLQSLAAGLNSSDSPIQSTVKHAMLQGKKSLTLSQKDGSTLTVADASTPVPLQIVNKAATSKGELDFSGYGASQNITAPQGAVTAAQAVKGQNTTT